MHILTQVKSWTVNPLDLGPIYPFVGWEMLFYLVCVSLCIAFTIWKFVTENAHYAAKVEELKNLGNPSPLAASTRHSGASDAAGENQHG